MKKLEKLMVILCLMFCFSTLGVSVVGDVSTVYAKPTASPSEPPSGDQQLKDSKDKFDKDSGAKKIKGMTQKVNPENNALTEIIGMPIQTILNSIIYILLTFANLWFFLQTCLDLVFLLSPAFRGILANDADKKNEKLKGVACTLVSEQALKACGATRSARKSGESRHITSTGFTEEIKWADWVTGRLFMFVSILAYLALLLMGLLPTLVNFLSSFAYAVLKAIMGLFGFNPDDENS